MNDVSENNCKLKLSNALLVKKNKFIDYINKSIVNESDIKIIALNSYNFGDGRKSCPYIASVLYEINEAWYVDTKTREINAEFIKQQPITKQSGSEISLGLFKEDEYFTVDGVLCFDHSLYITFPEIEFTLYGNKNKKNKLQNLFPNIKHIYYDGKNFETKNT